MRGSCKLLVAVGVMVSGGALCGMAAESPRDPEAVRQAYTAVASRLDQGGDLMIVANVDGLIERSMADLVEIASTATGDDEKAQQAKQTVEKLHAFLKRNGFYAINAVGMSSVPRADGLNVVKTFVSRDAEAAVLPLWRACVGGAPRELRSLRFMPADTEMARAGTADIKQLWALIQDAVAQVAPPEAASQFARSVAGATAMLGSSVDDLVGSIDADSAFGVQFSREANIMVPAGTEALSIPAPSMLFAIKVKDDSIMSLVKQQVTATGMPLTESQVEGTTVYSLNMPVPVVPVQLTLAQHDGFLLVGTMTQAVTDAIKAYVNRGGLLARESYKVAFAGQAVKHNGIAYISDRFGEVMRNIQQSALAMAPATGAHDHASRDLVQRLLNRQQHYSCAITMMNYKSGVRASGTTASSGQQLVASMAIAPVGMMAAIAIPSFMKARETSQKHACINNLRQIGAAKAQWALEQTKSDGDAADVTGVCGFIMGGAVPTCPKGGVYELNAMGSNPTCSIPGHELP